MAVCHQALSIIPSIQQLLSTTLDLELTLSSELLRYWSALSVPLMSWLEFLRRLVYSVPSATVVHVPVVLSDVKPKPLSVLQQSPDCDSVDIATLWLVMPRPSLLALLLS